MSESQPQTLCKGGFRRWRFSGPEERKGFRVKEPYAFSDVADNHCFVVCL